MKNIIILALLVLVVSTVVSAATLPVGQSAYLYQWTSNQPSKVSVDQNTGRITRFGVGPAEICAQLKSDLSVKFCNTVN